ncbi:3'(2'),5'-bisphosphate nucleotidase CysQ [Halomonas sp. M20]|uniref:3'(2'),5'-bisphosphate nucleotidase CysQ n=1 Tax=Halomonas sp. M20 TaxID=2763264 RepID=UPI001D0AD9E4|nr:3'(2'),5'-bisphosphate nucleotidase CysQ [Halomonas sp. M20]
MQTLDEQQRQRLLHGVDEIGHQVMDVYRRDFDVETKADNSPLTEADLLANRLLTALLQEVLPDTPVLSEEAKQASYDVRRHWTRYWLIDPIDGTKEFVKRSDEFTINVALIENGVPVFGIVQAPALQQTWWGQSGVGAFKRSGGESHDIQARVLPSPEQTRWKIVGSRSHGAAAFEAFCRELPSHERVSMGSSLKLCLVAEGVADLYPRLAPTCEWDTAAAHGVVLAAGGDVLDARTLEPLRYNRKESLKNPFFIVCKGSDERWVKALKNAVSLI